MADDQKQTSNNTIYYQGKNYPAEPTAMDRLKEGFQSTDDRAQIEAIRRLRQSASKAGLG